MHYSLFWGRLKAGLSFVTNNTLAFFQKFLYLTQVQLSFEVKYHFLQTQEQVGTEIEWMDNNYCIRCVFVV